MATFLLLYTQTGSGDAMPPDEAQQAAVMQAWTAWFERIGDALVDGGNPFTPAVKVVASDKTVSESPPAVRLGGYSIIKAYSHAVAAEIAKDCPVLKDGGQVLIYETFPTM